ncbi:MAG TPA: hypothetical protein PLI81_00960 [Petrotogaceae bacterium]|nr:hypothetical protein [Petrotogaceae bacterium]
MKKILLSVTALIVIAVSVLGAGLSINPYFSTFKDASGNKYLVYSITPIVDLDFMKLGIGFNAYQTEIGGKFFYGYPGISPEASNSVLNALNLNFLELDFGLVAGRYGLMSNQTFGLGTVMYRYNVPLAKAFDARLGEKNGLNIKAHAPFEIGSWIPFKLVQSASLAYADAQIPLGLIKVSALGATNYLGSSNNKDMVASANAYFDLFGLALGVEGGYIMTSNSNTSVNTTGYGVAAGAGLDLNFFEMRLFPVAYMSKNYVMGYIDGNYEKGSTNYNALIAADKERLGGIYDVAFTIPEVITANIRYSYDLAVGENFDISKVQISNEKIYGTLAAVSPFEGYPFTAYGKYSRSFKGNEHIVDMIQNIFSANTEFEYGISYSVVQGLNVSYVTFLDKLDGNNPVFGSRIDLGAELSF